jgi:hypothetical protein
VARDSSAEVKVFSGEVAVNGQKPAAQAGTSEAGEVAGPQEVEGPHEVTMEAWTEIVRDMQRIRIGKNGKPQAVENFSANPGDAWEQWNKSRNTDVGPVMGE